MLKDFCKEQPNYEKWSLTERNACHISVQNSEMGILGEKQEVISKNLGTATKNISTIQLQTALILGIMSVIGIAFLGKVVNQIWGKSK